VVASRFATGALVVALAVGSAAAARWVVSPEPGHVIIAPAVSINQNTHPRVTPSAPVPVPPVPDPQAASPPSSVPSVPEAQVAPGVQASPVAPGVQATPVPAAVPAGSPMPATPAPVPMPAGSPMPAGGAVLAADARSALAALPVKGPAPLTGYSRAAFGPAWADVDRSGCDQRNQVLARDLTAVQLRKGSRCVVASGLLLDPYTGKRINFVRGQGTSEAVQIDHVVALADAWRTGAQQLDQQTRAQMAGDLVELLAVDGPTNEAKRDRDAAAWLPANKAYRCHYVARQVAVKTKYRLWVIPAERDAIDRVLAGCPSQPLPTT
jgi:hypothetical protein